MNEDTNMMESNDVEPTSIDKTSKTNDYEKNIAKGARAAQDGIIGAMFQEGGMGELLNRDGKQDVNEDTI